MQVVMSPGEEIGKILAAGIVRSRVRQVRREFSGHGLDSFPGKSVHGVTNVSPKGACPERSRRESR